MKMIMTLLVFLLSFLGNEGSLETAFRLFETERYQESMRYFRLAAREYPAQSASIYYNMAQCMSRMDSSERALEYYHLSIRRGENQLSSLAYNNIGILLLENVLLKEALESFRQSIIQDPNNEIARYNFELLKRQLENKPKEEEKKEDPNQQQDSPKDPEGTDDPAPPKQFQSSPPTLPVGEYKELIERLRRRNRTNSSDDHSLPESLDTISLIQAEKILENMRNEDVQFLQQLRKSPVSPNKKNGKPDW
ncbi:MAG: tetratricopeptide repeat protein [Bacteroidota bacterium]